MTISVLIADDHALVRELLRVYLEMEDDIMVVDEASTGEQVLEALNSVGSRTDIVLLDSRMPGKHGPDLVRTLSARFPHVRVVMLSAYGEPELVVGSIMAGACGYVLKSMSSGAVVEAIRVVAGGGMALDLELMPEVGAELARRRPPEAAER